jgi:hypothetical protein
MGVTREPEPRVEMGVDLGDGVNVTKLACSKVEDVIVTGNKFGET